jgi:hypothetical protein
MDFYKKVPVRIPVKQVNGDWEFFYGGKVPAFDGTVGELLISRDSIGDSRFFSLLNRKTTHKVLDVGTELLVALTVRPNVSLGEGLEQHLVERNSVSLSNAYFNLLRSSDTRFVRVSIGEPTILQTRRGLFGDGDIWLTVQGMQPKGIITSRIIVPGEVSDVPLDSLNHAFTRLSERYEPWRKSHTGNIYDRVLYQEANGCWHPLNVLRDAALAKEEHELVRAQWKQIEASLRAPLLPNRPGDLF